MSNSLKFPWKEPADYGALQPLQEGICWLRLPLPFALDHINVWLLESSSGWSLVDTGIRRDEVKQLWKQLLGGVMKEKPLEQILVTHFHPDHFGLSGWLQQQTGAVVRMTEVEWQRGVKLKGDVDSALFNQQIDLYRNHGLDESWCQRLEARGNPYPHNVSFPPAEIKPLTEHGSVEMGDDSWQVIIVTGHAPGQACLYQPEKGILIAGDQILPTITPNVTLTADRADGDPLGDYLGSLKLLSILPDETLVLPSHGLPFYGLRQRISEIEIHHQERFDQLTALCEQPRSAGEVLEALFPRTLDIHQIMFAMGEAISHLVFLHQADHLLKIEDGGVIRYHHC